MQPTVTAIENAVRPRLDGLTYKKKFSGDVLIQITSLFRKVCPDAETPKSIDEIPSFTRQCLLTAVQDLKNDEKNEVERNENLRRRIHQVTNKVLTFKRAMLVLLDAEKIAYPPIPPKVFYNMSEGQRHRVVGHTLLPPSN